MATESVCDTLSVPIIWPATIDRTGETNGGIIPIGGFEIDEGEFCDDSIIESAEISIPVIVDTAVGTYSYAVTSTLGGSSSGATYSSTPGIAENINLAGQYSGSQTGTVVMEIGNLVGQSPSAVAGFAIGLTTNPGAVVTWGEPEITISLNNDLCEAPDEGLPITGIVEICLSPQTITDCEGESSQVDALPTVVNGVVDVRICPTCERSWETVFLCATADALGAGAGGRDILTGEQVLANLLRDCDDAGSILAVKYFDPTDPTFEIVDLAVGDCPGAPEVNSLGCIRDTEGAKWEVYESDGVTFYIDEEGNNGIPVGANSEWGSCCECVSVDNLPLVQCVTGESSVTWTIEWFCATINSITLNGNAVDLTLVGDGDADFDGTDIAGSGDVDLAAQLGAGVTVTTTPGGTQQFTTIITGLDPSDTFNVTTTCEPLTNPSIVSEIIDNTTSEQALLTHLDDCTINALQAPVPVLGELACITVDGVATYGHPAAVYTSAGFAAAGWLIPGPEGLAPAVGDIIFDPCGGACLNIGSCPSLDIGDAGHTTAGAWGPVGTPITLPHEACNPVEDIAVPISFGATPDDCLVTADPNTPILVRWNFDHSIEASTGHSGFSTGASNGVAAVSTIIASSNGLAPGGVHIGPSVTPHNGPRADYWVDMEIPLGELLTGVSLQTSALGTITAECETIHGWSIEISPDDVGLAAVCDCAPGGCC